MEQTLLKAGVNLGGWISQYPAYDYAHFDSFIREADIRKLKQWGCDHVRLPVDYPVVELEDQPGVANERGLSYVLRALDWCNSNGLKVILDLHKAPGFSFNALEAVTLFNNQAQQERFLNLWTSLARRLNGTSDFVAFELLNEIVLPDSGPWNQLARQAITSIRSVDPARLIVIGGNYYNSANQLQNLDYSPDPNLLYTFHFYEPMVVTHQKAYWVPALVEYDQVVDYPGLALGLDKFLGSHSEFQSYLGHYAGKQMDRACLQDSIQPALDFSVQHHRPVYCGEFGVIERAPLQTIINWTRDMVSIMRENQVGYAYWSYKGVDFSLIDADGKAVSDDLINILFGH